MKSGDWTPRLLAWARAHAAQPKHPLIPIALQRGCQKGLEQVLVAYPDATTFDCSKDGIEEIAYQDTEHFRVTRDFVMDPQRMLDQLFAQ